MSSNPPRKGKPDVSITIEFDQYDAALYLAMVRAAEEKERRDESSDHPE